LSFIVGAVSIIDARKADVRGGRHACEEGVRTAGVHRAATPALWALIGTKLRTHCFTHVQHAETRITIPVAFTRLAETAFAALGVGRRSIARNIGWLRGVMSGCGVCGACIRSALGGAESFHADQPRVASVVGVARAVQFPLHSFGRLRDTDTALAHQPSIAAIVGITWTIN
jgi:hypothetical protein